MSNSHFQAHKHAANAQNVADISEINMAEKVLGAYPASTAPTESIAASTSTGSPTAPASFVHSSSPVSLAAAATAAAATNQVAEAPVPEATPWSQLADLQRQQLAWLTECASTMFRGIESIRKTQQEAARLTSSHHSAAAQKMRASEQPDNWLELMSAPMFVDMEGCEKYWSQMASASVQTHSEIIQSIYQIFDSEKSPGFPSMQKIW